MMLTISKRFEFAASHRLYVPDWSDEENARLFGPESRGEYGHGHNYVAYLIFSGPVDPPTGMMINVTDIKREVNGVLAEYFDHKFLDRDNAFFHPHQSTPENIAKELLRLVQERFDSHSARPVACHVAESNKVSATAFADGRVERTLAFVFSAARRTCSPHLTDDENSALFGIAAEKSGHGHNYKLILTTEGKPDDVSGQIFDYAVAKKIGETIANEYDHRFLNGIDSLKAMPVTTECLVRHFFDRFSGIVQLRRAQLWENDWFFAQYDSERQFAMGLKQSFNAAHRLHSEALSDSDNLVIYDKCNNPAGHGHEYKIEATIDGKLDQRTGVLYDLMKVSNELSEALAYYDGRHLDIECEEFKKVPSTGENIVRAIWSRVARNKHTWDLNRLRLWETPNNRFTIRKED